MRCLHGAPIPFDLKCTYESAKMHHSFALSCTAPLSSTKHCFLLAEMILFFPPLGLLNHPAPSHTSIAEVIDSC